MMNTVRSVPPVTEAPESGPPAPVARRFPTRLAALVLFVFTVLQRPAQTFLYDAGAYFSGSVALFTPDSTSALGLLQYHGVLTSMVYAPAALVEVLIHGSAQFAVLVENAVLIAVMGALLLPGIVRALGVRGPLAGWISVVLVWLVVAPLAPYPLMDVPAAALFFGGVYLALTRSHWWLLAGAGTLVGAAVNVRAAYLFGVLAITAGVVLTRRWRALVFAGGLVLGTLPQVLYNLVRGAGFAMTPPDTAGLVALQASFGAYTDRYDTILGGSPPQQFYCDSTMAAAVLQHPVNSTGQLVRLLLTEMPASIGFLIKKVCAGLAWSSQSPYGGAAATERYALTVPVVLITVVGVVGLVVAARFGTDRGSALILGGVGAASIVSLMTSATETRFALPLVLTAIAGVAWLSPALLADREQGWIPANRGRLGLIAAGLFVLVLAGAAWGLSDAQPPGPASPATCSTGR